MGKQKVISKVIGGTRVFFDREMDVIYTHAPQFDVPFHRNQSGIAADICFEATTYCNVSCVNCFSDSLPSRPGRHLALQSILEHLSSGRPGLIRVCITGGEPLMHPEAAGILELPSTFTDLGFVLTTNGTLQPRLDAEMARHGWLVCVSIHGARDSHNAYERNDTHALAIARIHSLSEQGVATHIYAVLHGKFRMEDLEFLLQLRDNSGAKMLRLIVPRPHGRHELVDPVATQASVQRYLSDKCVLVCDSSTTLFVDVVGNRRTTN
jgi:molybdenum cofactor biosynthesis enzyme MoaA